MSIVGEITRINNNISAAYAACQDKNAELPLSQNSANLANTIRSITASDFIEPSEKDVNFYDYDGTLLYSYTNAEIAELTELPEIPTHTNLTANKWTDTLSNIKAEALLGNLIEVGALYNTVGGNTYLYLTVNDSSLLNNVNLNFSVKQGTLSIMIDNTVLDSYTTSGTGAEDYSALINLPTSQSYPANYIIKLSFSASGNSGKYNLGGSSINGFFCYDDSKKRAILKKIYLGSNCFLQTGNAFSNHYGLEAITLNETFGNINGNTFRYCTSLKAIIIPDSVTSIGANSFQYCYSLKVAILPKGNSITIGISMFQYTDIKRIIFPKYSSFQTASSAFANCPRLQEIIFLSNNITRIQGSSFTGDVALEQVKIPNSVTIINGNAFSACSNLSIIDLSDFSDSSAVPALEKTNAFNAIASNAVFYVKNQEMLNAFTTASIWSDFASQFQIKN